MWEMNKAALSRGFSDDQALLIREVMKAIQDTESSKKKGQEEIKSGGTFRELWVITQELSIVAVSIMCKGFVCLFVLILEVWGHET